MEAKAGEQINTANEQQQPDAISNIEKLYDMAGDYLDTRLDLFRMKGTLKASDLLSSIASAVFVGLFILTVFLLLNIGLGFWLGEVLGKTFYGFFALAGFYFLVGLILYLLRDKIVKTPVSNAVIRKIF